MEAKNGEAVLKPIRSLAGGLSLLVCLNSSPGLPPLSLSRLLGMFGKAAGRSVYICHPPRGSVAVICTIIDSSGNT